MRSRWIAGAVSIWIGTANPAPAQVHFSPKVAIGGGLTLPTGPAGFTDFWGPGFAISGGAYLRARSTLHLGIETGYYRHGFDAQAFETAIRDTLPHVNVSGNHLFVVPVLFVAEVALLPHGTTRPYASAGAGYYGVGTTRSEVSGPSSARVVMPKPEGDAFGVRFAFGVRTALTPVSVLFADASLHLAWIDPEAIRFAAARLGVRF